MPTNGIMVVGEAYGRDEELVEQPFVGASGRLLTGLLSQAGIARSECYLTNVFNLRPQSNDVKTLCGPKAEGIPDYPALVKGKYVRREFQPELERLFLEVEREKPNLVIALGASAAWAFLARGQNAHPGIKSLRGAPSQSWFPVGNGVKVLPTYHPAAILREYSLRPIVYADLCKAKREAEFPEVRRPMREIWIEPTLEDLIEFRTRYINPSPSLSIDIETKGDQITCIGFAPRPDIALVVPFFDPTAPGKNYWRGKSDELQAWRWVRDVCAMRKRIVFQNGLFDMHFLWRSYGIPVPYACHDTMLCHHALQPEMQKGLGFLASIYTNEQQWKFMGKGGNDATIKREG